MDRARNRWQLSLAYPLFTVAPSLAVWRERQGEVDFNLPFDRMAFWTSFLPGERRRLLKDGIHLEKIRYWSDALSRDVGRGAELEIKYDPRDLSRIFVRQSDGRFIEARYPNLAFPPVSWWEWKHAKKALRDKGRFELHEDVIFAALNGFSGTLEQCHGRYR